MVLKSCRKVLHSSLVLDLVKRDSLGAVDVDEHFSVQPIILRAFIPLGIDHNYVLAWLEYNFFRKERKSEIVSISPIDEFTLVSHQYYVEVGGLKLFARILLSVVHQTVTLLQDRNCDCALFKVDFLGEGKLEESLW